MSPTLGFLPFPWEAVGPVPEWAQRWHVSESDWRALVPMGRMAGWTAILYLGWQLVRPGGPPFRDEDDPPRKRRSPPRRRAYRGRAR